MKPILLASAICLVTATAHAGGYSEPVVTPDVVMTDAVESASPDDAVVLIMLMWIAAVALAS